MHTGHDERTRAVIEQAKRSRERHTETRSEHLPEDVRAALLAMAQKMPQIIAQMNDLERRLIEVERIAHPFRDQVLAAKVEKVKVA